MLVYLIVMAVTILFDLVFAGMTTWVLVGKVGGAFFVPEWFFLLCIAAAAVNGAFFVFTIVFFAIKRK
jgi:hypothetical protein